MSSVTGAFSIISHKEDKHNRYEMQNFGATVYGSLNSIESSSVSSHSAGMANSVLGFGNRTQNTNASLVWGTGNEVTNSIEDLKINNPNWNKTSASDAQKEIIKAMQSSDQYAGGSVMAIGGGNKADWAIYSQLLGVQNTLNGSEKDVSKLTMINGYKNTVTNAKNTTIIGSNNTATNIESTIVMGDHNTLEDRENVISLGNNNTVGADDAVAIGNGTTVRAESGVAIGVGSVADRVAGSEKEGALGAFAPANIPTAEKSTWTSTKGAVSVGDAVNDITRQITNVAAGTEDTDAVNVAQLKKVNEEALKHSTVTNGDNIAVTETTNKDGGKEYNVALKKNIRLSGDNDAFVNISGSNGSVWASSSVAAGNVIMDGTTATVSGLSNKTTAYAGFANGEGKAATEEQLKEVSKVAENANQGWNLSTNGGEASKVAPGETVDISGDKNIKISNDGTNVKVKLNDNIDVNSVQTNALNAKYNLSVGTANENGTVPFFVNSNGAFYAANGKLVVDKDGKVTATEGEIGNVVLKNGVLYKNTALRDGELYVGDADGNYSQITTKGAKLGKVTVAADGKITGVAAGAITADSTDAVNGSQLHAVQQEAGKHTKVVNGSNITVEETDQDGQKTYKVGLNKDILLGDITGKNVSISGTNGTIETTGYIATKDKVYADKGAKLADVDITGDTISNDKSSVKLDKEGTVTVNNKVTIDGNGKVSGVANGKVEKGSTDAVNGSQLKETNDRVTNVENDVKNIQSDITNIKGDITTIKGDVTNLGDRVTNVEKTAGKHSSVSTTDSNLRIDSTGTNNAGGIDYQVSLKNDLKLDSVTTGDTKMDTNGVTVKDVSLTKDGLSIGDKTYVSKDGLNANNQTITNVADGKVEKDSKDAVNGGQLYETNQAIANNATNISSLSHSISNLDNRVNKVGAGAAALAALHPLDFDPDAKWDFAAGYGNYRGANAAAVGAYYRPNEDTMFSVGGTFGNGENMVNAGVSFKLGSGSSHVSTSRVAMAKEIKELREHMAAQDKLIAQLTGPVNALTGSHIQADLNTLFPDVPKNHWAYDYVTKLAQEGYIEGYPDGNFKGDAMMTRYEFAAVIYRAMMNGAARDAKLGGDENLNKLLKEFEPELEYIRIDTIAKDKAGNPTIQRVRTVKANTNK